MSPTPLTEAVDAASYPDPHAHREALRKLCRELEQRLAAINHEALSAQIIEMHREERAIKPWA